MKSLSLPLLLVAILFALAPAACRTRERPGAEPATEGPRRFALKGVVRDVDAAKSEVTVEHEAIPGYMAGMTMPFPVKDSQVLPTLRPGDSIEATLVVEKDRYWL